MRERDDGRSLINTDSAESTLIVHLLPDLDVRLGIRNAFNLSYSDPIALNPAVDSMPVWSKKLNHPWPE